MTKVKEDLHIVTFPQPEEDEDHWTCCRNHDVSLCGKDVSDVPTVDFDLSGCEFCDHNVYTDYCPLGLICPEPEE